MACTQQHLKEDNPNGNCLRSLSFAKGPNRRAGKKLGRGVAAEFGSVDLDQNSMFLFGSGASLFDHRKSVIKSFGLMFVPYGVGRYIRTQGS